MLMPSRDSSLRPLALEPLEPRRLFCEATHLGLPAAPTVAGASVSSTHPLSSLPALSSRPGAPAALYLDFNGDVTFTWGSYNPDVTPALDQDGDPTTFNDAELETIRTVWKAVAEDYSPFN